MTMQKLEGYKRTIFFAITLIALGVVLTTALDTAVGIVLIAVGGLFFIIGMNAKSKAAKNSEEA